MAALIQKLRSVHDAHVLGLWLVGAALVAGVSYVVLMSPLTGTLSATAIGTDGSVRALALTLPDLTETYYTYPTSGQALFAAVPAPQGDALAYLTRTKDGVTHITMSDERTGRLTAIVDGTLSTPRWSEEGTSIAVAHRADDTHTPEAWTVLRAVKNGDSLAVGRGYKPFPSPNQRTYALSSKGIVLLSYADTEPTIVVASPVPVPESTPFTVSQDGQRVAWVAPADHSLQVFENVNGYFVPLLLKQHFSPSSLVFSPTGKYLMAAQNAGATSTLELLDIAKGTATHVGAVSGFIDLHTWMYDK